MQLFHVYVFMLVLIPLFSNNHKYAPNSNFHGANMGPIWGRQDPGGPHVVLMNLAIWGTVAVKPNIEHFIVVIKYTNSVG